MLPAILGTIFCDKEKMSWEDSEILKAWVEPKEKEAKQLVQPILEWMLWSCMKGRNKETSAAETDMSVVTLPSQKLKSWKKLRLEVTIGKWLRAQRVAAPHINTGSEVAVAVPMSVSQDERFLCEKKTRK